jgi:hypothetical protein
MHSGRGFRCHGCILCVAAQHVVVLPHSRLACRCSRAPCVTREERAARVGRRHRRQQPRPSAQSLTLNCWCSSSCSDQTGSRRPSRTTLQRCAHVRMGFALLGRMRQVAHGFLSAPCATGHVREVCDAPSAPGIANHTPRHSLRCSDCECRSYRLAQCVQYSEVFKQSTAASPVVFVLSPGADPAYHVAMLADKLGFGGSRLKMCSLGQGQGPLAAAHIDAGMTRGQWVMLQVPPQAAHFPAPSIGCAVLGSVLAAPSPCSQLVDRVDHRTTTCTHRGCQTLVVVAGRRSL